MNKASEDMEALCNRIGIDDQYIIPYGKDIAKISLKAKGTRQGKVILVTAMTPTTHGEGKTTTSIGLAQGMKKLGRNVSVCLREPSMGPVFGMKGGATGGGKSTVEPSDRINLMFTGDFPAISAAHNLLSAAINNHIYHSNKLDIDSSKILFPRTIDMNDRSLRNIMVGVDGGNNGVLTQDRFVITPASEIMAIVGLSQNYEELVEKLGNILVGFTHANNPVYCRDLRVEGAMAAILTDAMNPNLVMTTEGVPAFVHTGPFANIAHGTCSLTSIRVARSFTDFVIVEAGFGSDLGGEKFVNMVSRIGDIPIDSVVIVCTIRAILEIGKSGNDPLREGFHNLETHINNIRNFGREPVVCINLFNNDKAEDIQLLSDLLKEKGVVFEYSEGFEKGGEGTLKLAEKVIENCNQKSPMKYTYEIEEPVELKIEHIAREIYHCKNIIFTKKASKDLKRIESFTDKHLPVCIAKGQYSLSGTEDPDTLVIREVMYNAGAGFIVPISGEIMTMPGLPAAPSFENIHVGKDGNIENVR